jgi:Ca-activated chloride channel family protein
VSGVVLQSLPMLHLLWGAPLLLAAYLYAAHRRRRALEQFADVGLLQRLSRSVSPARRRLKAALVLVAFALIAAALARPAWNPQPKTLRRQGRDVVFVLDVSKSMLAEDLAPNRLQRAKIAIRDCVDRLQGDRVAIVAFAGTAAVKCPLTLDYGFFRAMLEDLSTGSIDRGGTQIGDAVRTVLRSVFDDQEKRYKDILLITDGEDHDTFPVQAAEEAGRRGIRLIAIGLGDADQGRRIPVTDAAGRRSFLIYQGREIWSRLDADTLRKMALATPGGRFLHVPPDSTIDLGQVYTDMVLGAEKKELESKTVKRYEEKFQIFMAIAWVLLCIECLVGERRRGG